MSEEIFIAEAPLVEYPDIAETIKDKIISEKRGNYACNNVWASEVGHDCERYLAYQQLNWQDAKEIEDDLLLVFKEGENQEKQVLFDMQLANIEIKDLQLRFSIKEAGITGKIDCIVIGKDSLGNVFYAPCEIKSMSEHVFNSVHTVADLQKYPWTRKYYSQVQIYLLNDVLKFDFGYLLVKNKSNGKLKIIKDFDGSNVIKFNEKHWLDLIDRAKRVNKNVAANKNINTQIAEIERSKNPAPEEIECLKAQIKYPDRIPYDIKVCRGCKFEHLCIVDVIDINANEIKDVSVLTNIKEYLQAKKEREKYKNAEKRYKEANESLKSLFPMADNVYMSDEYVIQTKIKKAKTPYLAFEIENIEQGDINV